MSARTLRLTIEFPGFYVEDLPDEFEEDDVAVALSLASETVVVVFSGHEGDEPRAVLRALEGSVVKYDLAGGREPT